MVRDSVNRVLREDVLGNDWRQREDDDVEPYDDNVINNNYEPFDDHDWSTAGKNGLDPTEYDPDSNLDGRW